MENINSVLLKAKKYLINNSIKSANIDSEILMCSVLKKSREYLILNTLDKIDDDKINIFNQLVERRKKREPIAYILKRKECPYAALLIEGGGFLYRWRTMRFALLKHLDTRLFLTSAHLRVLLDL